MSICSNVSHLKLSMARFDNNDGDHGDDDDDDGDDDASHKEEQLLSQHMCVSSVSAANCHQMAGIL